MTKKHQKHLDFETVGKSISRLFKKAEKICMKDVRMSDVDGILLIPEFFSEFFSMHDSRQYEYGLEETDDGYRVTLGNYECCMTLDRSRIPVTYGIEFDFDGTLQDFVRGFRENITDAFIENIVNYLRTHK